MAAFLWCPMTGIFWMLLQQGLLIWKIIRLIHIVATTRSSQRLRPLMKKLRNGRMKSSRNISGKQKNIFENIRRELRRNRPEADNLNLTVWNGSKNRYTGSLCISSLKSRLNVQKKCLMLCTLPRPMVSMSSLRT